MYVYIVVLILVIGSTAFAQQTSNKEVIEASLRGKEYSDGAIGMQPSENNGYKKNTYALPDAKGTIVSPEGKVIGRIRFGNGFVDQFQNNSYRISNTGQIIDFAGNLIGYEHPRFAGNKNNLYFDMY